MLPMVTVTQGMRCELVSELSASALALSFEENKGSKRS
jgi:hypothetical protein